MTEMTKIEFWNSRASIGENSGTNDFLLKGLEVELLLERVPKNSSVLDIGCGNGLTLLQLRQEKGCTGVGIDFSPDMIELAQQTAKEHGFEDELSFCVGNVEALESDLGQFDIVLTERCLQNLDDSDRQHKAFLGIMKHVRAAGRYFMIESFIEGLERTNKLRCSLGLEKIDPPWHNVFLKEELVKKWATSEYVLEEIYPFSSTYYFLSRVVYAKIAHDKGEELRYDSDINLVSCKLPPIGNFGPTRLYQWLKR
jgi:ubiquinone/menaquinone biosynthesis C-methylase UbiE